MSVHPLSNPNILAGFAEERELMMTSPLRRRPLAAQAAAGNGEERSPQAPNLKLRYMSQNGVPLMITSAERLQPPAFTEAAQKSAKASAIACGKPATRLEGLRAIHAVTHRNCFETEQAAWEHYSSSRQRFYEWKPRISTLAGSCATGKEEPARLQKLLHVQPSWINKTSPSIVQLDVSELQPSSDGCQANRLLKVIWNSSYGQRKLALGAAYAEPESVVDFSIPGAYPVPCPDCGLALTVYSYKLDECQTVTEFQRCRCDQEELESDSDDESGESEECGEERGTVVTDDPDEPDVVLEATVKYDVPKSDSARLDADRNRKREEECIRGFVNRSPFSKVRKL